MLYKYLVMVILASFVSSCRTVSSSNLMSGQNPRTIPTALLNVKVLPTNGGINPEFSGYRIHADLMLGSNPCMAKDVTGSMVQMDKDGKTLVLGQLAQPSDAGNRVCTTQFEPVTKSYEITVITRNASLVILKDVEESGQDRLLSEILALTTACQELEEASKVACCEALTAECTACKEKVNAAKAEFTKKCSKPSGCTN
jgi:hypothetical protein